MPNKLPVGEVLNEAFQFGLRRWGTVLRFAWLPVLALGVLAVGYFFLVFDIPKIEAANDPAAILNLGQFLRVSPAVAGLLGFGVYAVIVVFYAGIMTSIFRLVALGEERPGIFQFRIDGPTMRVFWALVIVSLIGFAIWSFSFFAALAITGQTSGDVFGAFKDLFWLAATVENSGEQLAPEQLESVIAPMGALGLTFLLAVIPLIYASVKLAPFPPGSAAENRLLLFGSLEMTKGHFWSIFGVYLLLMLLMMVIGVVVQLVFAVLELLTDLFSNLGGGAALVGVIVSFIYFGAAVIYQAFVYAVQLSAPAIIYRRLKTGK